jgi:SAM-dependent methyltransferase
MPNIKVSESRWEQAQAWELLQWQAEQGVDGNGIRSLYRRIRRIIKYLVFRDRGDDWNRWWAEQFDNYALIPRVLDHAIELGCGPFTNMRIISEGRKIRYLFCSDPLVLSYITLGGWLSDAYRKGRVFIDAHRSEECPFRSNLFDLVVMNNVLDHVQDAALCVQEAMRITKPSGFFVLGQDLTNSKDLSATGGADIGHPIHLTHELLDSWVNGKFTPVFYRILPRELGRNPAAHYGTYLYIGNKS